MISLIIVAALISTTAPGSQASSSDALHIAHAIGNYAGYKASKSRKIDYEITDEASHPAYTGYKTVQIMVNGHAIFDLSISTSTGRVVDFNRCLVFRYPVIRKAESHLIFRSSRDASYAKAMGDNGCNHYRVLRRPGDEAKTSPVYPVDQK